MCTSHDTYIARPYECDGYVIVMIYIARRRVIPRGVIKLRCCYLLGDETLYSIAMLELEPGWVHATLDSPRPITY